MKKLLTLLTLLTLAITTAWAGEKTVVFKPGEQMGASYVIEDGIKIQMYGMNNPNYYEQAPGGTGGANTFTVVTYNHLIKSIEFTCVGSGTNDYGPGLITSFTNQTYRTGNNVGTYTYSGHDGKWSNGLTQSITFNVETGRIVRFGEIKVTYFKDNGDIYDLVTDNSQLVSGGKYVLVSKYYNKAMSSVGTLYDGEVTAYDKQAEDVEWLNTDKSKVKVNDYTQVITLQRVESQTGSVVPAAYSIVDGTLYLRNTSNAIVNTDDPYTFYTSVTGNTNSNALISSTTSQGGSTYYIRYSNADQKFTFLTYASTYTRVYLYKQAQNYNVNFVATPTGSGNVNYTNGVVEIEGQNTSQQYETVKFTLTPNSGYRAKENGVMVVDANNNTIEVTEDNGVYTFTMPASNVTINAEFEVWQPHNISTICEPSNGGYFDNFACNGSSTDISQGAQYYRDDEITFKVKTNWGYRIVDVKMSYVDANNETGEQTLTPTQQEGDGNTYTVAMPDYNMTITATFRVAEYDLYLLGTHNGNSDWHSYGPKFNYDADTQTYWIDVYYKGVKTDYGQGTSDDGDKYGFFSITKEVKGNATNGDDWSISGRYGSSDGNNYKILGDYGSTTTKATGGLTGGENAFMIPAGVYRIEVTKDNNDNPSQVTVTRTAVSLSLNPAGGTEAAPTTVSCGTTVGMYSDIQERVHDIASAYATDYPQYIASGWSEANMSLSYSIVETTDLSTPTQSGTPLYTAPTFNLVDYNVVEDQPITVKVNGDAWIGWIHAATEGYYKVQNTPLHWIERPDKGVKDEDYIVSDRLIGVYAMGNILWAKDVDYDSNVANSMPEGARDYMAGFADYMGSVERGEMQSIRTEWEQKNWVQLDFTDVQGDYTADYYVKKYLAAGTVRGKYVDDQNYKIRLTSLPTASNQDNQGGILTTYQPNYYCPVNFMASQSVSSFPGEDEGFTDRTYYFLNPKIQEYAIIVAAMWDKTQHCFVVSAKDEGTESNMANLDGAFSVAWDYNNWNAPGDPEVFAPDQTDNLDAAQVQPYMFHAIIQKPVSNVNATPARLAPKDGQTPASNYLVYPLDLAVTASHIVTAVQTVGGAKAVQSVTYCDLAGRMSSKPFAGINIVVTRYTDGTVKTSKLVF